MNDFSVRPIENVVISFPGSEQRLRERARWIVGHDERLYRAAIQDEDNPMGLRLINESCVLCGGFFAPHGEVCFYYSGTSESPNDGAASYLHVGCRAEARNWADLPAAEGHVHWRPVLVPR